MMARACPDLAFFYRSSKFFSLAFGLFLYMSGITSAYAQKSASESSTGKRLQDKQARILAVAAIELQQADGFESKRQFSGQVEPKRRSELGFERVGQLQSISVDRGDEVHSGQILAQLDSESLLAQRKKLSAELKSARAQLQEAHAGPRVETIDAARANLAEQKSQLALAEEVLARREKLHRKKLIAAEEFDQAQAARQRWNSLVDASQSRLNELLEGTRSEQIDALVAKVESIEAAIDQVDVEIEKSILKCPFDGVVVARTLDEGSIASPGRGVLTVVEFRRLEAKIGISTTFAKELRKGQSITAKCSGDQIKGSVKAIIAEVDLTTRTQPVIITLEEDAWQKVVPGDTLRVEFGREEKTKGYWVPTEALVAGPRGLWNCFVVEHPDSDGVGTASVRTVEVIHTDGDRSMIQGQIDAGEWLISRAPHRVISGQAVQAQVENARP